MKVLLALLLLLAPVFSQAQGVEPYRSTRVFVVTALVEQVTNLADLTATVNAKVKDDSETALVTTLGGYSTSNIRTCVLTVVVTAAHWVNAEDVPGRNLGYQQMVRDQIVLKKYPVRMVQGGAIGEP